MRECPEMVQTSLRKTWEKLGKFLVFSVRPREFVDAERVRSDQKTLFFDENGVGFEPGALRRVNLILADNKLYAKLPELLLKGNNLKANT